LTAPPLLHLILVVIATLAAAKILGLLAQRIGQPAVVGELIAGVILGSSVLGLLDPSNHALSIIAEIGVIVLLFEIGLETDIKSLVSVGAEATTVALVGVVVPFGAGYAVAHLLGLATIPALVSGAALTATSVGISVRTLSDLKELDTREGQTVLGAAVLDDIVGLAILFVISLVIGGSSVGETLVRSATLPGAFAIGLILHGTSRRHTIERITTKFGLIVVPIFFATVGAAVDIRTLGDSRVLLIGGALTAVGIIGKFVAGYAPFWLVARKSMIGIAMIPRGEVGLIFARMGLATGALTSHLFSAVAMMVLVTTFITPPLLSWNIKGSGRGTLRDKPGEGGIDDLVSGTHEHKMKSQQPGTRD
jgi:Kef-type K+ transport system membrane component KefB